MIKCSQFHVFIFIFVSGVFGIYCGLSMWFSIAVFGCQIFRFSMLVVFVFCLAWDQVKSNQPGWWFQTFLVFSPRSLGKWNPI